MKHTPGPWEIDGHNLTAVIHNEGSVTWPQWKHVCNCDYGYADPEKHFEENKANAHLIAAAPEMLEALESVMRLQKLIEYPNDVKECHVGEAMAVSGMLQKVIRVVNKAKGI